MLGFLESTEVCRARPEQKAEQLGEEESAVSESYLGGLPQFYPFEDKPSDIPGLGERWLREKSPRWLII